MPRIQPFVAVDHSSVLSSTFFPFFAAESAP
jgi:hypothetical protein